MLHPHDLKNLEVDMNRKMLQLLDILLLDKSIDLLTKERLKDYYTELEDD